MKVISIRYLILVVFFALLSQVGCEEDPFMPTVTTAEISGVESNKAICGGNVKSDGGEKVSSRGVCWSTTSNPSVSDSKTNDGAGIGTYISTIINLSPGETYYVRAYATNSVGTAYGQEKSFTTTLILPILTTDPITSITTNSASCGGEITSDGGSPVTVRGVCWNTAENPTISNSKTTDGDGTGEFTSSITELLPGITYHVRAYATNEVGTAYGDDVFFSTFSSVPSISTTTITSITHSSAVGGGNVTSDGGSSVTARGVCWSTSQNPTMDDNFSSEGTGTGEFVSSITSLSADQTYHVRAYAINSNGTAYGNDLPFTTLSNLPSVPDNDHMLLGNPSEATTSTANANNYLMVKPQYCLSYNNSKLTANWTSWHLYSGDLGDVDRQDDFRPDNTLPAEWYWVPSDAYSGSGFDRGHLCPSADRTNTIPDNSATFVMTNMIPQSPNNNRVTWANLENYSRDLVDEGNELFIVAGPYGQGGTGSNGFATTVGSGIVVPSVTWKVIVVLPDGDQDLSRISASTRVIAIVIPNDQTCSSQSWDYYRVSVDYVESLTGYDFMSNVPSNIQDVIEATTDNIPVAKQNFTPEVDLRIEL